jgi:hypothetical protein
MASHLLHDLLGKRARVGRTTDQNRRLDIVHDCQLPQLSAHASTFKLDRGKPTIHQRQVRNAGVLAVPFLCLLVWPSVRELSVTKRTAHGFDEQTVTVDAPATDYPQLRD